MPSNSGGSNKRERSKADAKNGNERKKRGKGGGRTSSTYTSTSTDKEKVVTPVPLPEFLRNTYDMIDTCEQSIACWTKDGDMFVVKNPTIFAKEVIPKYFDHDKFPSFTRQLNFYGFTKIKNEPLKKEYVDQETSTTSSTCSSIHTWYHEHFKRGRQDLLSQIRRSTNHKDAAVTAYQEQQAEIQELKGKVKFLEDKVKEVKFLEDKVKEMWEIHQFQQSNNITTLPSGDHHHDHQKKPSQGSHDQHSSTSGGRKEIDLPRREAQRELISEEPKEAKPRQPTLKPHPNSKTLLMYLLL